MSAHTKKRTLYPHVCEGCGKKFFSYFVQQKFCSRSCASKNKVAIIGRGGYSWNRYSEIKNAERNKRLEERDRKAEMWLGKDARGSVRGRVFGIVSRTNCGDFVRWY